MYDKQLKIPLKTFLDLITLYAYKIHVLKETINKNVPFYLSSAIIHNTFKAHIRHSICCECIVFSSYFTVLEITKLLKMLTSSIFAAVI